MTVDIYEHLHKRIAELEAALAPFIKIDPIYDEHDAIREIRVTAGDLRRAKVAYRMRTTP